MLDLVVDNPTRTRQSPLQRFRVRPAGYEIGGSGGGTNDGQGKPDINVCELAKFSGTVMRFESNGHRKGIPVYAFVRDRLSQVLPRAEEMLVNLNEMVNAVMRLFIRHFSSSNEVEENLPAVDLEGDDSRETSGNSGFADNRHSQFSVQPVGTRHTNMPWIRRREPEKYNAEMKRKKGESIREWAVRVEAKERERVSAQRARMEEERTTRLWEIWERREVFALQATLVTLAGTLGVTSAEFMRTENLKLNTYLILLAGFAVLQLMPHIARVPRSIRDLNLRRDIKSSS